MYTAFVYFTPIIGGFVSDRWLGKRNAVIAGASMMALGHFMMTFEPLFYGALAAIALGNGLFLPSLPSQIKGLYAQDDPRLGSAFNIYYVGINVGGFLAPIVCGTIGELYGWHYGFALAGIGMLAGLAVYIGGRRYLPIEPARARIVVHASADRADLSSRYLLLAGVMLAVVIFRSAYEQIGNTVAIWAGDGVDRTFAASLVIPMTWFQSLNSLLVFVLTPFVVAHWLRQAKRQREPASLVKMAIGAAVVAAAYAMLACVAWFAGAHDARAAWYWLVLFFIVLTAGELYILPIGLGLFSRLAPTGFGATTIAAWFLAAFGGNLLAGVIGSRWSFMSHPQFFALMAAIASSAGVLLLLLNPAAQRAERRAVNKTH
jgi:POT family proton-dependent oligopeptide transporter